MQMKKFINDPNTLTDELLEGLALAHADTVDVQGHLVISRALEGADRVTIVTFGGSGHEPAQCGFVGEGMVDIQVVGDIFAAPNPQLGFEAVKMADKGHGVLLLVLNHAGDMLCGNMVMKMAGKAGLNVRKVVTQEDISNAPRSNSDDRRGGDVIQGDGARQPMKTARETIEIMANALVKDIPLQAGDRAFVMINGSGATTLMEMFILYKDCVHYLEGLGIEVVANMVGEILTVQEQAGFQLNIAKWDEEFLRLWNTPAHTPAFFKE